MFETLGYIAVVVLVSIGIYYLSHQIEEYVLANDGTAAAMVVLYFLAIAAIFFSGFSLGGRGQRVDEENQKMLVVAKEQWSKEVKSKMEAYNAAFLKKNAELAKATNEVAVVKVRLDDLKGYMSSNMVPRYVVAPIPSEIGPFRISSIFPNYDFNDEVMLEPATTGTTNTTVKVKSEKVSKVERK